MANSLITYDEFFEIVGKTKTGIKDQEVLEINNLIASASQHVEDYCNRKFTDYVDTDFTQYDNGDRTIIYLRHWPVISITDVSYSEDRGLTWETLVEDEDYIYLDEEEAITTVSGKRFYKTGLLRAVRINYRAGYTEIPDDLKLATAMIVNHYLKDEHTARKELMGSMVQHAGFTIEDKDWPGHIKRLLDNYRDINVY